MDVLFFDLDGTLTNPKLGITRSIQHALEALGHEPPAADDLDWCIGPPLLDSFVQLLGTETAAQKAIKAYRERFAEIGLFENDLYPEIPGVLGQLKKAGHPMFVATSKPVIYAERIINHFSLDPYFERVFGSELDGTNANKSDLLAFALKETGVDPRKAKMIGDRKHDIIGARNNGLGAIGVLYGYGSEDELTHAGADHICLTPIDIWRRFDG